jgi:hypothetical protein
MFRHLEPVPQPHVIDSSDYKAMQSLLESKARDIARLQRQVEDLQNSIEALQHDARPIPRQEQEGASQQRLDRSAASPLVRQRSAQPLQGRPSGKDLPRRITVSLNDYVHQRLIERSAAEGRSVSNLAAFILESHLDPD